MTKWSQLGGHTINKIKNKNIAIKREIQKRLVLFHLGFHFAANTKHKATSGTTDIF